MIVMQNEGQNVAQGQKLNKLRTFTQAQYSWSQKNLDSQPPILAQTIQRQRSFLPSGIQNPLQAIQINSEVHSRRSVNQFRSPFRLNQKLQGLKEAKKDQLETSYSQPILSDFVQQNFVVSNNSAFKQTNTKRRKLNDRDSYIEYLKINSEALDDLIDEPEKPDVSISANSSNSIIERQETPHFGETKVIPIDIIQREFSLKIELVNSIIEEDQVNALSAEIDHNEQINMHIALPEGFEDWCQSNEINMSIPDSLEISSEGHRSSQCKSFQEDQDELQIYIQDISQSHQALKQNDQIVQFSDYDVPSEITSDLITSLTQQYFSKMLDIKDE